MNDDNEEMKIKRFIIIIINNNNLRRCLENLRRGHLGILREGEHILHLILRYRGGFFLILIITYTHKLSFY